MLCTPVKYRLAVFEAKRQDDPSFLFLWENYEFGSTLNALKAYDTLLESSETGDQN